MDPYRGGCPAERTSKYNAPHQTDAWPLNPTGSAGRYEPRMNRHALAA